MNNLKSTNCSAGLNNGNSTLASMRTNFSSFESTHGGCGTFKILNTCEDSQH